MKTRILYATLASALAVAFTAAHAEVQIYKQPNFTGAQVTLRGDTNHLGPHGFMDQASSIVVSRGQWEFCSQPNYQGDCLTLGPGRYATLDPKLNHRVESLREVTAVAKRDDRGERYADRDRGERWRDRHARGSLDLFAGPYFRGRALNVEEDVRSLRGTGFEERGSSLVIHEGRWQVCTQPGFEGRCRVFEPGRYANLGSFDDNIGSMRLMRDRG
jgi:hypothetical protein